MRKISIAAAKALKSGTYFKGNNTEVAGGHLSLHGNRMATFHNGKLEITNAGWQSNTTKERLNAILDAFDIPAGIYHKDWAWYYEDVAWDGRWKTVYVEY